MYIGEAPRSTGEAPRSTKEGPGPPMRDRVIPLGTGPANEGL